MDHGNISLSVDPYNGSADVGLYRMPWQPTERLISQNYHQQPTKSADNCCPKWDTNYLNIMMMMNSRETGNAQHSKTKYNFAQKAKLTKSTTKLSVAFNYSEITIQLVIIILAF